MADLFITILVSITVILHYSLTSFYSETKSYLSYSFNPAEQIESDGKWKFSSFNGIGQSLAGHVFIHSQAESPDKIATDSNCDWFKSYGPKKNRRFRQVGSL